MSLRLQKVLHSDAFLLFRVPDWKKEERKYFVLYCVTEKLNIL